MLTLPIKRKWYEMILTGEKKEEYREIKPYWAARLAYHMQISAFDDGVFPVKFINGYGKKSPAFNALVTCSIGTGKTKWGATAEKEYFILKIKEIKKC